METGDLVRIARHRAGLSQEQLGIRSGVHRNVIGRWERGHAEPSLTALRKLITACDLELVIRVVESDRSLDELVADQLALHPVERLTTMLGPDPARQVMEALHWLAGLRTPVIAIGDVAAALLGAPQRVDRPQVEILSRDARSTETELEAAGFRALESEDRWRDVDRRRPWRRGWGTPIALATDVPGTMGFADLLRDAERLAIDDTTSVLVAHPRDLLRIADASPREGAQARAPGLQALLSQHHRADR